MLKVYSISLGCPKNRVDSERTLGSLGAVVMVESPQQADVVFVNTCGFIAPAIEESVRTIVEQIALLDDMPQTKRPFLVVAGCLVGRFGEQALAPDLPEVDLFLHNNTVATWGAQLASALGVEGAETGRLISTGKSYAWLKISDGCRHNCSFCTIPSIRGKLVSYDAPSLVAEAKQALSTGVKELVLVAQDLTAWGKDKQPEERLQHLLEQLLPLDGLERLRLMYLYPAGLTHELLQFLQGAGKPFVPYFDVPLQHASASVLARMGRPFATDPTKVMDRIRHYFPQAALRTSIIVGFPGETEQDYATLCDFVVASRFMHLGVFAYEQEEGTEAAAMPQQIPDKEKQWRRDNLMHLQSEISEELLAEYLGQRLEILVDEPQGEWDGLHIGRTWFQAPESDGVTYISGKDVLPGAMVQADITETKEYDLVALADTSE